MGKSLLEFIAENPPCWAHHVIKNREDVFARRYRQEVDTISADFFTEARRLNLKLNLSGEEPSPAHTLDNEALFQLPLLAMTILAISKGLSKPQLPEIGQLVGECLERTVAGFKGSPQDIGWSGNLRIRTIKALTFLESTGQVTIDAVTRRISATELGKKVYNDAANGESVLAVSMKTIELPSRRPLLRAVMRQRATVSSGEEIATVRFRLRIQPVIRHQRKNRRRFCT